jgi:hypothetical protein
MNRAKLTTLLHMSGELKGKDGGAGEDRTPYLLNAIQALYQMSYDPIQRGVNLGNPVSMSKVFPGEIRL